VRGFSEGSAGGDSGRSCNLEGYAPDFSKGDFKVQALAFFDTGQARAADGTKSSISGTGIGLRAGYAEQFSLRLDVARIINADTDALQAVGNWRVHVGLSASF
jgi:hemolysin activation/secretion protein